MEPSLAPGTFVAGYVIEDRLGAGGFGEVFRATHSVLGRKAAIKVLHAKYSSDPIAVARFVAEARAVNQISHPGIVEVFDFGTHAGRDFFVMELLAGRTLRALLDERTRVPLAEAVPLLRGIAAAVDAAHAAGVAHRDLKPDNVFVLDDGTTKLIDFGIAKLSADAATLTETGSMLGTPQYMSPEQCRGRASDARTDQYSFGALAYHVLVGEPPFSGEPIEIALHHLNDRPQPPSKRRRELPAAVDRSVLALLAKDPAMRPASCGVAVSAMTGAHTLRLKWSRRTRIGLVAVPLALAGIAAFVLTRGGDDAVVAANACQLGVERLEGVWDPITRVQTIGRLYGGVEDQRWRAVVWRDALAELEDTTTRWTAAWDAACPSPDRATDPLLYGERVTCLENALLDLRTGSDALRTIDVPVLGLGLSGFRFDGIRGRLLADCANERVLRAQVAAPPGSQRDRVTTLLRDAGRIEMEITIAFARRDTPAIDGDFDRLAAIARDIEAIDAPSAASVIAWRGSYLALYASDVDQRRRPAARRELVDGIARIERSGDSVAIAQALLALGWLELMPGDGDAVAKLDELMPRIEAAVARAGEPLATRRDLVSVRAQRAMRRGRYADAIAPLREAVSLSRGDQIPDARRFLSMAMGFAGRGSEAVADATAWFAELRTQYGPDDAIPVPAWLTLAVTLDASGDLEGALRIRRAADRATTYTASHQNAWSRMYILELEMRVGRVPDGADATIRAIGGRGTTPHLQNPDGPSTARRAGMFDVFAYGADRDGITGNDERADNATILAFERGDRATMAKLAAGVAATCAARTCGRFLRFSRWLAAATDPSTVDASLASLEKENPDPFATAYSGIVLAWLGRWTDARTKLEAARGVPHVWESQADLAELDAWLGLARKHAGDLEGARRLFEEALAVMSIWSNGFDGFSYMTPTVEVALAEILWAQPDGDRPRAKRLVEHAIKGFARLGSFKDADRAAAQRWLAEHG